MRNKIRQMMKKEDGFTLVELLAVIVILGLIVALAIPAIGNVINRAEDGTETAEAALIIDAARLYEVDNGQLSNDESVSVETLMDQGFLENRGNDDAPSGSVFRRNGQLTYEP